MIKLLLGSPWVWGTLVALIVLGFSGLEVDRRHWKDAYQGEVAKGLAGALDAKTKVVDAQARQLASLRDLNRVLLQRQVELQHENSSLASDKSYSDSLLDAARRRNAELGTKLSQAGSGPPSVCPGDEGLRELGQLCGALRNEARRNVNKMRSAWEQIKPQLEDGR